MVVLRCIVVTWPLPIIHIHCKEVFELIGFLSCVVFMVSYVPPFFRASVVIMAFFVIICEFCLI